MEIGDWSVPEPAEGLEIGDWSVPEPAEGLEIGEEVRDSHLRNGD